MENIKKKGFAVTSMVLGIISILISFTLIAYITGILAIIFGIIALIKKNSKALSLTGLILGIISLICCTLFIIFGNKTIKPLYDDKGNPIFINENEISYIYSDASKYFGKFVNLNGKVFNEPERDGEYTAIQIWADPQKSEKNTIVYYNGDIDIKNDEYVKVTGYVANIITYSNAFSGSVSAPVIVATNVEKSSYLDTISPTKKEVKYTNKVINQHNCQVEVNKVEFAENETRVYVTAKNNSKAEFSLYTYGAVITQNGKQYEQQTNYEANYEELQSDIKSGITCTGILVFPKIEQSNFSFIIDGSSEDYDIDIEDYKFNLEV